MDRLPNLVQSFKVLSGKAVVPILRFLRKVWKGGQGECGHSSKKKGGNSFPSFWGFNLSFSLLFGFQSRSLKRNPVRFIKKNWKSLRFLVFLGKLCWNPCSKGIHLFHSFLKPFGIRFWCFIPFRHRFAPFHQLPLLSNPLSWKGKCHFSLGKNEKRGPVSGPLFDKKRWG